MCACHEVVADMLVRGQGYGSRNNEMHDSKKWQTPCHSACSIQAQSQLVTKCMCITLSLINNPLPHCVFSMDSKANYLVVWKYISEWLAGNATPIMGCDRFFMVSLHEFNHDSYSAQLHSYECTRVRHRQQWAYQLEAIPWSSCLLTGKRLLRYRKSHLKVQIHSRICYIKHQDKGMFSKYAAQVSCIWAKFWNERRLRYFVCLVQFCVQESYTTSDCCTCP